MSTIIEVIALKKSYKRKADTAFSLFKRTVYEEVNALKGIDFKVLSGERVGFIGLNGAGKSTTIKLLTGILHLRGESPLCKFNSGRDICYDSVILYFLNLEISEVSVV